MAKKKRYVHKSEMLRILRRIARRKNVLFHGTTLGTLIVREDMLRVPKVGAPAIAFTRSPAVALHFATLRKDGDDGLATVFAFNRDLLAERYPLKRFRESSDVDEAEERVWRCDITPVFTHLLASVFFSFNENVVELESSPAARSAYLTLATASYAFESSNAVW